VFQQEKIFLISPSSSYAPAAPSPPPPLALWPCRSRRRTHDIPTSLVIVRVARAKTCNVKVVRARRDNNEVGEVLGRCDDAAIGVNYSKPGQGGVNVIVRPGRQGWWRRQSRWQWGCGGKEITHEVEVMCARWERRRDRRRWDQIDDGERFRRRRRQQGPGVRGGGMMA
jgi:hypothetical protein